MAITEHRLASANELNTTLAAGIAEQLKQAIHARDHASLVVSGGRTPRPLFENLARITLDWARVQVTLADERWVEPSADDSNERMLRDSLLRAAAADARFVALKNAASDPAQGQPACEAALRAIQRPFDVVVLGMGADGHTASLFPGVAGRALDPDCTELCLPAYPTTAAHPRMSLTAAAILNSRRIVLHITGAQKWEVYRQALEKGPVDELPVRVILAQDRVPVDVFWSP